MAQGNTKSLLPLLLQSELFPWPDLAHVLVTATICRSFLEEWHEISSYSKPSSTEQIKCKWVFEGSSWVWEVLICDCLLIKHNSLCYSAFCFLKSRELKLTLHHHTHAWARTLYKHTHFLPYFYSLTNLFSSSVFSSNTFQSLDCLPLTTRTEILFLAVNISLWNVDWLYSSHFSPICCQHHLHLQNCLKLPFLFSVFSFSLSPPPFQAD